MVLGQAVLDARNSQFRPIGNWTYLGFQTYDVACLDCGYVGTCLSEDERSELEKKIQNA